MKPAGGLVGAGHNSGHTLTMQTWPSRFRRPDRTPAPARSVAFGLPSRGPDSENPGSRAVGVVLRATCVAGVGHLNYDSDISDPCSRRAALVQVETRRVEVVVVADAEGLRAAARAPDRVGPAGGSGEGLAGANGRGAGGSYCGHFLLSEAAAGHQRVALGFGSSL